WDGNEVWLVAAGGVLFLAFPRAYSAAFSGFYLAFMIVLWLLILRGVAIAFRSQVDNPLWREFWDTTFVFSSTLLAIVLGTALGNSAARFGREERGGRFFLSGFWLPSPRSGFGRRSTPTSSAALGPCVWFF